MKGEITNFVKNCPVC
jgi:hypothetical protein